MNTGTTTIEKQTISIKFVAKLIVFLLLLGTFVYSGASYFNQFAHKKKQKTEQQNNSNTKSNSKNWQNKKKSGKNEPHKNQNIKKSVEKQINKYEEQINKLKQKNPKTKEDIKLLRKLKKAKKRIIQNLNKNGETHSIKAK